MTNRDVTRNPFPRLTPYRGYGLICLILDEMGGSARWQPLHMELCDRLGLMQHDEHTGRRNTRGYYAHYFSSQSRTDEFYAKDTGVHGPWRLTQKGNELVAWLKKCIGENRWPVSNQPKLWTSTPGTRYRVVVDDKQKPPHAPSTYTRVYMYRTTLDDRWHRDKDHYPLDPVFGTNVWKIDHLSTQDKAHALRFELALMGDVELVYKELRKITEHRSFYVFTLHASAGYPDHENDREVLIEADRYGKPGAKWHSIKLELQEIEG